MAHKACFEHCVKRASLSSYFSALFFLLVPYGGDTVSTLTVRTWREIHLPKHVPEQKCLWSKGFQPRAHRWCRGRPEHPHSLKCCIVMVCTCVHTWIFFSREKVHILSNSQPNPLPKMFRITNWAVNQPGDPHSHLKLESPTYCFIHALIQFMLEHLQWWKPDRMA